MSRKLDGIVGPGLRTRMSGAWPWISTLARVALAAVFLVAGGLKVGDLAGSGRAVNAYQVMPFEAARIVGAIQPFVEIAVGLLLLIGIAVRLSAAIAAALLVVFIAGIVSARARGLQIDCGCFSKGGNLATGGNTTYARDVVRGLGFLILAGILLWRPQTRFSVDGALLGG